MTDSTYRERVDAILETVWGTALDAISDDFREADGSLNEDGYKGYKSVTFRDNRVKILALIAEAQREARLDELEHTLERFKEIPDYSDWIIETGKRIAALDHLERTQE